MRRVGAGIGGALLLLLGVTLVTRPFASLAILALVVIVGLLAVGAARLAEGIRARRATDDGWVAVAPGVAYLLAGLALALWSGATLANLALIVGLALLADATADLWAAWHGRGTARVADLLGGVTSLVLAGLALAWPDVTTVVVAVVFGARVAIVGVRLMVASVRGRTLDRREPTRGRAGWGRVVAQAVALAVTGLLVAVSAAVRGSASAPDAFYDEPDEVPAEPGALLRSEPFTSDEIPDGAQAWRILYTTTEAEDTPAVASGLVIVPDERDPDGAPVVAWAHGTTGASPGCAPSVLSGGLAAGAMFVQDQVLAQGWAIVAADYVGLGTQGPHLYLVGEAAGRAVLDAVRAAHELGEAGLGEQAVVWGHSQGGAAALWTGQLASAYAPELDIDGVVALAPASNLPALLSSLANVTGGDLFASYVITGYVAAYPDVTTREYVRPAARPIVAEMSQRCLADRGTLVSILQTLLLDKPVWTGDPDRGAFHDRLVANIPSGEIDAPLLLSQGEADPLVVPGAQAEYVDARCAAGYSVDYRTYPGLGHVPLVEPESPAVADAIAWTQARLAGDPPTDTCP